MILPSITKGEKISSQHQMTLRRRKRLLQQATLKFAWISNTCFRVLWLCTTCVNKPLTAYTWPRDGFVVITKGARKKYSKQVVQTECQNRIFVFVCHILNETSAKPNKNLLVVPFVANNNYWDHILSSQALFYLSYPGLAQAMSESCIFCRSASVRCSIFLKVSEGSVRFDEGCMTVFLVLSEIYGILMLV